jgi:hypothetical protein
MGLISFALICAFTLLYLSSAIPNKPAFIEKTLAFIKQHLNYIAMGGLIYGFVAFCITPLMTVLSATEVFIRMAANFLIVVMAIPYTFERLIAQHETKINAAILKEIRNIVTGISAKNKVIGVSGAVLGLLLFATVFH